MLPGNLPGFELISVPAIEHGWASWCMAVILVLGRLRQNSFKIQACLGYIVTLCLKPNKNRKWEREIFVGNSSWKGIKAIITTPQTRTEIRVVTIE
jgi:hypothetical protein